MKIKKIIILSGLSVMMLITGGCSSKKSNEASEVSWKTVKTVETKVKSNIGGFNDETFGLTVGFSGESHYSTDGGTTWPKGENDSKCRFGLDIVDNNIAWSSGNGSEGSNIRKTLDGGKTWLKVTDFGEPEPNHCRYVSFLDDTTGWVASPTLLGSTTDGGTTWNTITLPENIGNILAINIIDTKTGYLFDDNKKLYTTTDFGSTWTEKTVDIDDFNNSVYKSNGVAFRFTDSNNGLLFYYTEDGIVKGISTNDGGDTWKNEGLPEISALGPLYISRDSNYLSVNTDLCNNLTLLKK